MFSLSNVYSSTYQSLATLTAYLLEQCLYSSYASNYVSGPYFMAFRDILLPGVAGESSELVCLGLSNTLNWVTAIVRQPPAVVLTTYTGSGPGQKPA
jgi:hypothetical protein